MLLISPCTREEAVHENHPKASGLNFALDNELCMFHVAVVFAQLKKSTYFHPGELPHFRQLTVNLQYFFLRLEAHLGSFLTLRILCRRQLLHIHCCSVEVRIQLLFYSAHKWLTLQTAKPTSAHSGVHTARELWG